MEYVWSRHGDSSTENVRVHLPSAVWTLTSLPSFARLRYAGWKKFYADDYIIIISAGLYTGLVVCLNVISDGGGSNLYPPGTDATFTPQDIKDRIYGSKIVLVSEQVSRVRSPTYTRVKL